MASKSIATPHFCPVERRGAERINLKIIRHLSDLRALSGMGAGERAPSGAARPVMDLVEVKERSHDAALRPVVVDVTRPGFKTARRRVPAVLARMDERNPMRRAA